MAESELLHEENQTKFSPRAAYARDIVIFVIVGLIAIKISVIPFLNHLDKMYVESLKNSNAGPEAFLLGGKEGGGQSELVASSGVNAESNLIGAYAQKCELEIVSLKAAHSLEIAELKQEHIAQMEEIRSKVTISALSLESKDDALKKCEALLEKERARVDKLLDFQERKERQKQSDL